MNAKQIEARIMCDMLAAQLTPGPRSAFDVIAKELAKLHVEQRWQLTALAVVYVLGCATAALVLR